MNAIPRPRGQPLIALAAVLLLWVLVRIGTWQPLGSTEPEPVLAEPATTKTLPPDTAAGDQRQAESGTALVLASRLSAYALGLSSNEPIELASSQLRPSVEKVTSVLDWTTAPLAPSPRDEELRAAPADAPDPLAPSLDGATPPSAPRKASRWSVYGWAFARQGARQVPVNAFGAQQPSYGASQVGAVLRYRLPVGKPQQLQVYGRASQAVVDNGETDLALGLAARPIASVPVLLHGELRATSVAADTFLRPAVFVTSQIPPVVIAPKVRAEIYGQAGYVGGQFATPFVDGQARIDRTVVTGEQAELRLGGGVWGGAQEGAGRVDIGPTARALFQLEGVPVQVSVDYRVQIAGKAQPGSGVAVTLSSGF